MNRAGAILSVTLALFAGPAVLAADEDLPPIGSTASDPGGSIAQRYERARHALEDARTAENKSRAERDRLAGETQTLQSRLVENATRVQQLEADAVAIEKQSAGLQAKEIQLQAVFAKDRETVAHLLAVLQRLDSDAPPALVLEPKDSLGAARGAMQLGAMLPPVYERAAILAKQLRTLADTQKALTAKRAEGKATALALVSARAQLAELLVAKSHEKDIAETKLGEISEVTETVAQQADDLKSLIDRISVLRRQNDPQTASSGMVVVRPDPGAGGLNRGSLLHPVVGGFQPGDPAGPGSTPGHATEGLWFDASSGAQAVAPGDGEVIFAGAYQKFGQVLILEIAGGYDLLLAGLGRIDVHIGDLVLAGEPVGVMPRGVSVNPSKDEQAALYMELRRNGQTVNPAPWMSAEMRKAKRS